jgi:hypothetical protein
MDLPPQVFFEGTLLVDREAAFEMVAHFARDVECRFPSERERQMHIR